jgi:hypothetical protein
MLYNKPEVAAVPSGLSPTPLIIIIIIIIIIIQGRNDTKMSIKGTEGKHLKGSGSGIFQDTVSALAWGE